MLNTALCIIVLLLSDVVDFPLRSGSLFSSPKTNQISIQKAYAAALIGSGLCLVKEGFSTREEFVLDVENLMRKKNYDLDILKNANVQKAGKLIENKLGNDCTDKSIFKEDNFVIKVMELTK